MRNLFGGVSRYAANPTHLAE